MIRLPKPMPAPKAEDMAKCTTVVEIEDYEETWKGITMNNLKVFNFKENQVRTQIQNDDVWFCLKDVCDILGLTQPSKVRKRLNEKGVHSIPTLTEGGTQSLIYVNESNLYKVIFQSRKPQAEAFTEWVTSEVLPTIRKSGGYVAQGREEDFINKYFPSFSDNVKLSMVLDLKKQNDNLQSQLNNMKADIKAVKALTEADGCFSIGEMAKILKKSDDIQIGRNRLYRELRRKNYLMHNNIPYQKYINQGLFVVKPVVMSHKIYPQTLVTPKGSVYLKKIFTVNN